MRDAVFSSHLLAVLAPGRYCLCDSPRGRRVLLLGGSPDGRRSCDCVSASFACAQRLRVLSASAGYVRHSGSASLVILKIDSRRGRAFALLPGCMVPFMHP